MVRVEACRPPESNKRLERQHADMISDSRLKELGDCLNCVVRVRQKHDRLAFQGTLCKIEKVFFQRTQGTHVRKIVLHCAGRS